MNNKERISLVVEKDVKDFIKIISDISKVSIIEVSNLFLINGIDTFLLSSSAPNPSKDIAELRKSSKSYFVKTRMENAMVYFKNERRTDENKTD